MRRLFILLAALAMLAAMASPGQAQSNPQPAPPPTDQQATREQLLTQIAILKNYIKELQDQNAKTAALDPEIVRAYREAVLTQYEGIKKQAEIVNTAFADHRLILFGSLLLVGVVIASGIVFSWLQLRESLRVAGQAPSNDIEISTSKLRLTTSVIGVIVLAISLAFFYIFATTMLKIEVAGNPPPPPLPRAAAN